MMIKNIFYYLMTYSVGLEPLLDDEIQAKVVSK